MRSAQAILGSVTLPIVLIIVLLISAICLDSWHLSLVRTELQNAVDAAALAAARDADLQPQIVVESALHVAALNFADGRSVANDKDCQVLVEVLPRERARSSQVRVQVKMNVQHSLSRLFGRNSDFVFATATAGGAGAVTEVRANQLFPLAVSINAIPHGNLMLEPAINNRDCGDALRLYIHNQQVRNASFTTFDKPHNELEYLKDAIARSLGKTAQNGGVPAVKTGDTINLNLGITGQRSLSDGDNLQALNSEPVLNLPVISGDPQYSKEATVVGFIGFKVKEVSLAAPGGPVASISGVIVRSAAAGRSGNISLDGDEKSESAMRKLSMAAIKLLPNR